MISSLISKFEFSSRRALFLSANKVAVYHWQKGELGSSYLFDTSYEGRDNFERYLKETPKTPMYILADVFEEEYRRDTIPHVFGSDRQALIERKQARLFRDTPYRFTKVQGREAEGRQDDLIFLSAITNPDLIKPWVALLEKYKIPMQGINSLPLFTESLLSLIPNPSNNMLLVSLQSISGLRQTFFQNGEFRISRLVQMPRYGTASYSPLIHDEVEKVRRYLNSLRLISPEEPLDIYFLLAGSLLEEIDQEYTDSDLLRYHLLDINSLLEQSTTPAKLSAPFADQFFIYQFLKQRPKNRYASSTETRYAKMRRMRYAMLTASVLLIMSSVIWGGFNTVSGLTYKQRSIEADNKARFYSSRYEMSRERLPKTPVDAAELLVAVELAESIAQHKSSPIDMVKFISKGLNQFPDVTLDNVEWAASSDPNLSVGKAQHDDSNQGMTGFTNASFNDSGYRYYQIAMINGHIAPFDGNFREAIAIINKFTETLRNSKSVYDINIVTLPLDVRSNTSLQGDTRSVAKKANFSIRLVLGIGNE